MAAHPLVANVNKTLPTKPVPGRPIRRLASSRKLAGRPPVDRHFSPNAATVAGQANCAWTSNKYRIQFAQQVPRSPLQVAPCLVAQSQLSRRASSRPSLVIARLSPCLSRGVLPPARSSPASDRKLRVAGRQSQAPLSIALVCHPLSSGAHDPAALYRYGRLLGHYRAAATLAAPFCPCICFGPPGRPLSSASSASLLARERERERDSSDNKEVRQLASRRPASRLAGSARLPVHLNGVDGELDGEKRLFLSLSPSNSISPPFSRSQNNSNCNKVATATLATGRPS